MFIYIYINGYHLFIYIYVNMHLERERERERRGLKCLTDAANGINVIEFCQLMVVLFEPWPYDRYCPHLLPEPGHAPCAINSQETADVKTQSGKASHVSSYVN